MTPTAPTAPTTPTAPIAPTTPTSPTPPTAAALRIGELARRTGTTTRTIRYYEQLGLLGEPAARRAGCHRSYTETDVTVLAGLIRLRELLGLSLEELRSMQGAEEARALLRAELEAGVADPAREREILAEALEHLDLQRSLVRRRQAELDALGADLERRRRLALALLAGDRAPAQHH